MSGPGQNNGRAEPSGEDAGVLANLPRTRPQRSTARRAAARGQDGRESASRNGGSSAGAGAGARKPRASKPAGRKTADLARPAKPRAGGAKTEQAVRAGAKRPRKTAAKRPAKSMQEVPRQGFESEEDRATGAVSPPGGTELVGTAAEIVSEFAKASISGGERLLRDVLSRLGR